jgi:polyphosphate glucokinase
MRILVIDVGGNNVKVRRPGGRAVVKIPSGPRMTAARMVRAVLDVASGWQFDAVTIGYPGPVTANHPAQEPHNLGGGWARFDYRAAFRAPVRIINDAAMQALGSYEGGRMLYLGLGTGLGSALVIDGLVVPTELAHLPYRKGLTYEDYVGQRGYDRMGRARWAKHVQAVVACLQHALLVDYVVLGGGNVKRLGRLPLGCRMGSNGNAFRGGVRVWDEPRPARRRRVLASTSRTPRRRAPVRRALRAVS